jgi:hypothetical protein
MSSHRGSIPLTGVFQCEYPHQENCCTARPTKLAALVLVACFASITFPIIQANGQEGKPEVAETNIETANQETNRKTSKRLRITNRQQLLRTLWSRWKNLVARSIT